MSDILRAQKAISYLSGKSFFFYRYHKKTNVSFSAAPIAVMLPFLILISLLSAVKDIMISSPLSSLPKHLLRIAGNG
jgi:hypothetical protein